MGLRAMLNLLVAVALLSALCIGAMSFWGASASGKAANQTFVSKDLTADILPPPLYLIEMRLVLSQAIEGTMPLEQAKSEFKRLKGEYDDRIKYWKQNPPYGLEAKLMGAQHQDGQAFIALAGSTLEAVTTGGSTEAAQAALRAAHQTYLAHRMGVNETVKQSAAFAEASTAHYEGTIKSMGTLQGVGLGIATVLLIGCGVWIRRAVWSAVGGEPAIAASVARAVAQGDLTVHVPVEPNDHRSIMAALSDMQTKLAQVVSSVRQGSETVASASHEIAQGNTDLSARTEQQASSLEETAASMEQLSATVKHNADGARQANQLAVAAAEVAAKGGQVVTQVVETMKGINDSSRKIADIIGVIDGIAFQTNILALNAAVEAARAGEQGRGFAVVASEVRSLAGRSADAAKEIKSLISASVERVEHGNALVENAGITMTEVVTSIKQLTNIMGEISAANSEQTTGFDQVGEAIGQMDHATQQNAALVEEMAAAASSLNSQANELVQTVAIFQLGGNAAGVGSSTPVRATAAASLLAPGASPSQKALRSPKHVRLPP
jgi:methyl-accepting chemotaxis protein